VFFEPVLFEALHLPQVQALLTLQLLHQGGLMKLAIPVLLASSLFLGGCAAMGTTNELLVRGMYSYLADAALFTECRTGRSLPVTMEGDNRALELAYLQARAEPGEALLVTLEGRIVSRMPMEGPGPVAMLLPDRFIGIQPGKNCQTAAAKAVLLDSYWRLTYLGDVKAVHFTDQREPHIVLHGDSRVTGSDGCNLLMGSFRLEHDRLAFSQVAMTMMACPQGLQQEQGFSRVLGNATRYRIVNEYLELLDDDGTMLARFEAMPFR